MVLFHPKPQYTNHTLPLARPVNPTVGRALPLYSAGFGVVEFLTRVYAYCIHKVGPLLRWAGALTFGYRCTVYDGVDVEAGDAEVDVIYVSFIVSVQYIG